MTRAANCASGMSPGMPNQSPLTSISRVHFTGIRQYQNTYRVIGRNGGDAPPAAGKAVQTVLLVTPLTARWRASSRFQSFPAPEIDGARDADADRSRVCGEPVVLTTTSSPYLQPLPSLHVLLDDALSRPCPAPAAQQAVRSGRCAIRLPVCSPRG